MRSSLKFETQAFINVIKRQEQYILVRNPSVESEIYVLQGARRVSYREQYIQVQCSFLFHKLLQQDYNEDFVAYPCQILKEYIFTNLPLWNISKTFSKLLKIFP